MQDFLEYVVKNLVDEPEEVQVSETDRNGETLYQLKLAQADIGKIVGRKGATISAIRSLVIAAGAKAGKRCSVEIVEEREPVEQEAAAQ
jgi:predicted RNA-binding protein YlqC (UPF0109 family)